MEIEIKKLVLHHLDVANNEVERIDIDFNTETIIKYVDNLIEEILDSPNKRKYLFKDGDTQVKSSINHIVEDSNEVERIIENNAVRLLEKETAADAYISRMGKKVLRGSLLHIHFLQNNNHRVLICKVEHDEIINEQSFELNRGLNTKKKVFKAFLIYVKAEGKNEEIYLSDKNNSKYWWYDFLELEQVKTDEENTEKSVEKLIGIVSRSSRKQEHKLDGTILRNHVIGYFRSNKHFNFSDLVSSVFQDYQPHNSDFPITKIFDKVTRLTSDDSFDKQFLIAPDKIGKKKKNSIKIAPGLVLSIEDYVKNLDVILKPYSSSGKFGMTIISDEAYNFIKEKENDKGNNN